LRKLKTRSLAFVTKRLAGNLSILLLSLCLGVAGCGNSEPEITPEMRMAGMFLSRSSIGEVSVFRDTRYIHGLSYFYFHMSDQDIGRVISWLKMKERNHIPPVLTDRIRAASTGTNWKFEWNTPKIYATFYCHPFDGTYWSADLLLVENGQAVFMTEGYLPPDSSVTEDPASCEFPTKE
jgi:hypothetical protein